MGELLFLHLLKSNKGMKRTHRKEPMNPTMKIGVNARTFSTTEPGGAVQTAKRITSHLIKNPYTEVVLFGNKDISDSYPDIPVDDLFYPFSSQAYGLIWERSVLPYLADKHDVDILYCPNGNGPLHKTSFPVIICIHDVNAQKSMSSSIHQIYRKSTVPRAASAADGIITVSEFSKQEICSTLGVNSRKIKSVYNGINGVYLSNSSGTKVDLPKNYVLYVGALNPRKNIKRLIKTFKKVKEQEDLPHDLVLIGPGNNAIFQDVNVDETGDIKTPGYLTVQELKYAYTMADVFFYPSLYEGFGLPPLEAMACGTPVVASTSSSLPEILDDAAELADPYKIPSLATALSSVLNDPVYRNQLIKKGHKRAEQFKWERTTEETLMFFDSVINQR